MQWKLHITAVVALSLWIAPAHAKPEPAPAPPAAATQPAASADLQDRVLPDISFEGLGLKDALDFLADVVGFQTVIVRDPSLPADYPVLPNMKLKKVTLGQFLSILQEAFPGIEVHPIESEKGSTIYVFNIHGAASGLTELPPQTVLKVYRLSEVVQAVAAPKLAALRASIEREAGQLMDSRKTPTPTSKPAGANAADTELELLRKKSLATYDAAVNEVQANALNSVLSLIKATLMQAGNSSVNPVIQLHEETQTLIFRGTPDQVSAVQKALEALTPQAALAPLKEQFAETERRYEAELAKVSTETARDSAELQTVRAENESLRKTMLELEVAREKLNVQFEALKNKSAAKE